MAGTRISRAALVALAASCIVAGLPTVAPAADASVSIRDNLFIPQEVHVDPGDEVTWSHLGTRFHDVTSDDGDFASGDLGRGSSFSHEFPKEGFYYYHCSFHGRSGKIGMWGVVVVGDPKPPDEGEGDGPRPQIRVPKDFQTIQGAVDAAEPGSTIVVAPGTYRGDVRVTTDDLIVRGADRYRTVLDGGGTRSNGFLVEGAAEVTIADLTVRDFTGSGVRFEDSRRYTAARIDAIKNATHAISAYGSYDGVIESSFGWGSGHSAFYVGACMGCGALLEDLWAETNYVGYSGTDSTGVTVRGSTFLHNGAGIVTSSTADEPFGPGRGTLIVHNVARDNDNERVPPPPGVEPFGIPVGTGVWLAGVANNVVRENAVSGNDRFGVLVTEAGGYAPQRNTVVENRLSGAPAWVLAWDGAGSDDCFSRNLFDGATGPPDLQSLYACDARPFTGTPYEPVREDVAAAIAASRDRDTAEVPEPVRPRCQKGRPGCHGH